MTALEQLLNSYRQAAASEREKGTYFEELILSYLFMREVEDYGPKHPLWKDFGDVQKPFWDWWCDHGEDIFMTGVESGVEELTSDEDIQRARAEGAYLVRVDPDCTRDYLMFVFQDFLDEKGIRKKPGRRKHKDEMKFARYPFYQRPDVESLRVALEVWKLKQKKAIEPPARLQF